MLLDQKSGSDQRLGPKNTPKTSPKNHRKIRSRENKINWPEFDKISTGLVVLGSNLVNKKLFLFLKSFRI